MGVGCWDTPFTDDHLLVFCLWLDGVVICLQGSSCPRQFVVMVAKLLHDKYHGGCLTEEKGWQLKESQILLKVLAIYVTIVQEGIWYVLRDIVTGTVFLSLQQRKNFFLQTFSSTGDHHCKIFGI